MQTSTHQQPLSSLRTLSTAYARQHFADTLVAAQHEPIAIIRGSNKVKQPVAILMGGEAYSQLSEQAAFAQLSLKEMLSSESTGNAAKQLKALREKAKIALAALSPKPVYQMAELLALAPKKIPLDQDFLNAPRVGKEAL
jgi:PHD/YefM family antitoxin component YafN of YafNO toxin-antitoxin module